MKKRRSIVGKKGNNPKVVESKEGAIMRNINSEKPSTEKPEDVKKEEVEKVTNSTEDRKEQENDFKPDRIELHCNDRECSPGLESANLPERTTLDPLPLIEADQVRSPFDTLKHSQSCSPFGGVKIGSPDSNFISISRSAFAPTPLNNIGANSSKFLFSNKSPTLIQPASFAGYLDLIAGNGSTPISNTNARYSFGASPVFKNDSAVLNSPYFQNVSQIETQVNDNSHLRQEEAPK